MKNILNIGYKQISSGTDDYRRGEKIRPLYIGTIVETFKILEIILGARPSLVVG